MSPSIYCEVYCLSNNEEQMKHETNEMLRASELRFRAFARRTDAIIEKWESERAEAKARRRRLIERAESFAAQGPR